MIVTTRSDGSRPPVPIDRDQCDGCRQVHFLISVFAFGVKCDGGRPRSQQEGPARAAEWPRWLTQRRAREVPVDPRGRPARRVCASFLCSLGRLAVGRDRRDGRRRCLARLAGFELAHRRAVELEPVGIVDNAIQDRVAESGLADNLMPGCHGELAGDEDGAAAMAILDDLHEIAPLAG